MEPFKERQLAKKCKDLGNVEIRKAEYAEAICHYSQGLTICPNDIDLLSNRSLAYLQLGCYECALSDVEQVLKFNPRHEKCLYRKVKVLWGLNRYQVALDFVETEIPTELQDKPDFKLLHKKSATMLKQSQGDYNIEEVMSLPRNKTNEVAEYTGPVEISQVQGKGRGLLATSDIKPGQLIICSKAFALLFEDEPKRLQAIGDTRDYCVGFICQKLSLDPSLRPKFFDLYPGPSDEVPSISKSKTEEISKLEVGLVDSIVIYNGFSSEMDLSPWAEEVAPFLGVWILPSYVNHSCMDANAYYYIYGDVMFIRAVRFIKKGQEVTIAYTPPGNPARREYIEIREFKCDCQLCLMDDSERMEVRQEVEKTLSLIQNGLDSADLGTQVSRIRKLIALRSEYPSTNLALLDPCIELVCSQLKEEGDWKTFAEIFEKSHQVSKNNCYVMSSVYISINLVKCYLALADEEFIQKWVKQLKLNLINCYGSIEALKYLNTDVHTVLMAERGISFFNDLVLGVS